MTAVPSANMLFSDTAGHRASTSLHWFRVSLGLFAVTLAVLALRLFAIDAVIDIAARLLSGDGHISVENRATLAKLLVEIAVWTSVLGLFAYLMSREQSRLRAIALLRTDPLESSGQRVPDPIRILAVSTTLGVVIIALWLVHMRNTALLGWLFAKEGFLELATFVLLILSAGLCASAARSRYRGAQSHHRSIAASYAALALGLFVIGMEEVSWGQTYLRWQTPESWAVINSQQETTLHNLADQHTLHVVAQRVTFAFVALSVFAMLLVSRLRHPYIRALAPHFSTIGIVVLIAYAAWRFHLEISEVLFSIFAGCYAWRVYRAAKGDASVAIGVQPPAAGQL